MLATLVIVFREVLEAGLIVGIVLAATRGVPQRGFWVTAGIGGGLVGACLVAAFAGEIANLFAGTGQELFNAAILLTAVVMLTWHNTWMAAHGRELARDMRQVGADVASGERPLTALAVVVGVAVLREGSEVVLFLYGIAASGDNSSMAMLAGGALGVAAGSAISALLYFGLLTIPLRHLFSVTSALIIFLAAGLASQAIAFLQQAGYFDAFAATVWDTSWLLSSDSLVGRLLHTFIGYTDRPNEAQLLAYIATVATMVVLMHLVKTRAAGRRVSAS
jgi:high-affinity iron transporter